ncbi:MAG: Gldg family protein [Bdellovibrionales bacterium]|nr:Gldg family protein [Bdellovibrionales bacterium]
MNPKIKAVTYKELSTFFASPIAFIFLGTFLLVNLFLFFTVERFFARNIVDVRPLFDWMPILLIFLVASLTMKMWSEEQRMGTLEFLLTSPVKTFHLVMGKFLAALGLVVLALVLTLGIPITTAFTGNLDWGPVIGAYLASVLLAAAYISVGLFVSSKSDNQIVSLIVTVLLCSVLYILGSPVITGFFGNASSEVFRLLGTGTRFESINRGVIDFRDLYYYLSLVGVFLTLNMFALEKLRWSSQGDQTAHRKYKKWVALCVVNFLVANIWLYRVSAVRLDLTEGDQYSISEATDTILSQLQEPLLLRGYFSAKTHPLLAPLVPQVRDMLREFEIAGGGKVRAEFIDPQGNPELEEEANRKYNIKSVPFQFADRYQSSLVNSYFNILVQYGDKYEVLSFADVIEVTRTPEGEIDSVFLRNLEYDITRSIKKVLYGFNDTDSLLTALKTPIKFSAFVSADSKLPEQLVTLSSELKTYLKTLQEKAGANFSYELKDPGDGNSELAQEINERYGFRPMVANLLDPQQFYFYMLMEQGTQVVAISLPKELNEEGLHKAIDSGLERFSPGALRTVGLVTPPAPAQNPMMMRMGMPPQGGRQFRILQQSLELNNNVQNVELKDGAVPENVDLLMLLAPENLSPAELFAVDQFLMKGGTVVVSSAAYGVSREQSGMQVAKTSSGITDWLASYGISFEDGMVLDAQNEPYPVPVRRNLGQFTVQEIKLVPYPFFPDMRGTQLDQDTGILGGIPQITLNWPSPILVDAEKNKDRKVHTLLRSSEDSWLRSDSTLEPDYERYPDLGFPEGENQKSFVLASMVEGSFESFFKGKDSPLHEQAKAELEKQKQEKDDKAKAEAPQDVITNIIEKSPSSSRIVVYGSNEFLADQTMQLSGATGGEGYRNSLQLMENTVDWSLEDRALLSIRSRGKYSRTMHSLGTSEKTMLEWLNYGLIVFGLFVVFSLQRTFKKAQHLRHQYLLQSEA